MTDEQQVLSLWGPKDASRKSALRINMDLGWNLARTNQAIKAMREQGLLTGINVTKVGGFYSTRKLQPS